MTKIISIRIISLLAISIVFIHSAIANTYHNQAMDILKDNGLRDIEKALMLFNKALQDPETFIESSLMAANICLLYYEQMENPNHKWLDKGLGYIDLLQDKYPENTQAYVKKAQLLMDKRLFNQAVFALKKALRINPGDLEANLTYVGYLLKSDQIEKGYETAQKSFADLYKTPIALKAYALLFLEKKEWKKAESIYMEAMKAGLTNDYDVLTGLGDTYRNQNRSKDALHVYENALKVYPQQTDLLLTIYQTALSIKDSSKATSALEKYLFFYPGDIRHLEKLASLYEQQGEMTKAAIIREKIRKAEEKKK